MKSKILLIEDSRALCKVMQGFLGKEYKMQICATGEAGLETAKRWMPTLILLDIVLPGIDGFEVLSQLKKDIRTQDIPVIFITGIMAVEKEEMGLNMGAVDYIRKPLHHGIVRARVKTHVLLYNYRLRIEQIASLDGLTGIFNRHAFDERAKRLWKCSAGEQSLISVLILDVDFFKAYNDNYGHLAGDQALRLVAEVLRDITQGTVGLAARYGGEEFIVLLPWTGKKAAMHFAEEIRLRINNKKIVHAHSAAAPFLSVSIGGSTQRPDHHANWNDFVQAADQKLYAAKEAGRNKVMWSELAEISKKGE